MKKFISSLLITFSLGINSSSAQSPVFDWARHIGDVGSDAAYAHVVDPAGNIYVAGYFEVTVDFDPGSGVYNIACNGMYDGFVVKLDSNGVFQWAKNIGASGNETVFDIALDGSGNILISGFYDGTTDLDPGTGIASHTSAGLDDVFILKLDNSGNYIWSKTFGGIYYDAGYSLQADNAGNIYIAGYFADSVDFDPGAGTSMLSSPGATGSYLMKLDASGNFSWAKLLSGGPSWGRSVFVDAAGNNYTAFYLGSSTVFVQKRDASGNVIWQQYFFGAGPNAARSLTVDASGNVYTCGYFSSSTDFDPGTSTCNDTAVGASDIFIQKLDPSGNFLWAKSVGGIQQDDGSSVSVDNKGNVYATGYFRTITDFDPGAGVANITPIGANDVFLLKLDSLGNYVWAKNIGGPGSSCVGYEVEVTPSGSVYISGTFTLIADFDPGAAFFNMTYLGKMDIFITKWDQPSSGNSIAENENEFPVTLYPNPSSGPFQLSSQKEKIENIEIYDVSGRLILKKEQVNSKDLSLEFPFETGIYFIRIQTESDLRVLKFVKK